MGLVLEDVSSFDIFSPVPHAFVQMPVHCFDNKRFAGLIQGNRALSGIKIFILYLFPCKKIHNNLISVDSKGLNEIKNKGLLVVIVRV